MRRKFSIFALFVLWLFTSRNVYSEDIRIMNIDDHPAVRQYILWKVYTQYFDNNNKILYMTVDSVLRGDKNFYTDKKWKVGRTKYSSNINLNPNTYYLVLADALCDTPNKVCPLLFFENDYALPDTQENREMLIKKWNETKVIYTELNTKPYIKGRDVDM